MGLRVTGLATVLRNFRRSEEKVARGSLAQLKQAAEEVAKMARKMAPIDLGDLEEAIEAVPVRTRTALGRFGATEFKVGVNIDKLDLGRRGGFDYSVPMHEGVYNLGPLSSIKQAAQGEQVGPKYLERALQQLQEKITQDMQNAVRRSV